MYLKQRNKTASIPRSSQRSFQGTAGLQQFIYQLNQHRLAQSSKERVLWSGAALAHITACLYPKCKMLHPFLYLRLSFLICQRGIRLLDGHIVKKIKNYIIRTGKREDQSQNPQKKKSEQDQIKN